MTSPETTMLPPVAAKDSQAESSDADLAKAAAQRQVKNGKA
ncbi:hypothetical protein [Desulfuromonas thiophila]|nr:hypothetical protein [Desulfuromonas thiophila]